MEGGGESVNSEGGGEFPVVLWSESPDVIRELTGMPAAEITRNNLRYPVISYRNYVTPSEIHRNIKY